MPNETIKLTPRYKMAHDIYISLFKIGFDEKTIQDFLNNIDDADVVEVVHGEWIADRSPVEVEFRCSECGYSYIEADSYQSCDYNYCPNCGAKMDGERRSE